MVKKTIDEILAQIGSLGVYQWCLMLLLSFCMATVGLQALTMTFIAKDPGWQCASNNTSVSRCNLTGVITTDNKCHFAKRCNLKCKEWEFPEKASSIVKEFNLYCKRSIYRNVAISMVFLGWFIGSLVFGYISDKFGRRKASLLSMFMMAVSGVASSFAGVFWLFCLLKVFVGAGIGGALNCIFILNTEFVGLSKRPFAATFIWNFWTVGMCIAALLGYLIPDWKYLNFATSLPAISIVVIYFFLPESVRWEWTHNQHDKVEKTLRKIARINAKPFPESFELEFNPNQSESGNIIRLFTTASVTVHVLICMFSWFACSVVYYGVSLSTGKLGGNIYLVFFLTSIIAIPGNLVSGYVISRFGSKRMLIINIFITAIALICASLLPKDEEIMEYTVGRVGLAMLAKFFVTIAFNASYLITFELLPTTLRNVGMGLCSSAGRIGSFASSYLIFLDEVNRILPFIIIGIIAAMSGSFAFLLPETKDVPTKEVLSDVLVQHDKKKGLEIYELNE